MAYATTDDGVKLHFEETGRGFPVLFVHEFAGEARSWEPQVRCFSRNYRCITYDARGYPPSDVPEQQTQYSQQHAVEDARAVLSHLGIGQAHVVGLSMGAFCVLHFGLQYPALARSLVVAGCGYGAPPEDREAFRQSAGVLADRLSGEDPRRALADYAREPVRQPFRRKDPRGWEEFEQMFLRHSTRGAVMTLHGVQRERPSLYAMGDALAAMRPPVLLIAGDEDEPSLDATLFLKRTLPTAGLLMLPNTGHTINLEEPDLFNRALTDFFNAVENGGWTPHSARQSG